MTRIVITGANGQVGRSVLQRLLETSADVTAVVRRAATLRSARTLVCGLDDVRARRAIASADVVMHLAGTLRPKAADTYYGANVATAAAVASAARGSSVKRIIVLSTVHADEASVNEYRQTKAVAERVLKETRIPTVIFRATHIIGPPDDPGPTATALLSHDGEPVKMLGNGRNIVAPVFRNDVAEVLARAVETGRPGVYDLCGPERMTMDELAMLLNRDPAVPIRHLPERLAMFLSPLIPGLTGALIGHMTDACTGDPTAVMREWGITLHALGPVWNSSVPPSERDGVIRGRACVAELSEPL